MVAPSFEFYESDSTPGSGTPITSGNKIEFGAVPIGAVSLPTEIPKQQIHLWNDKGSLLNSDTATNIKVYAVASDGDDNDEIFTGTDLSDDLPFLEARSTGAFNTPADAQSGWTPIGPGEFLDIGDMPKNSRRTIELRLNTPNDATSKSLEDFELRVSYS